MSDIDRIRRDVSLSATAQSFGVQLQADGHEFEACCPLHNENTPSFTIFTGKDGAQRFHCFGCGVGGDVIDFVEKIQGVSKRDAIDILLGNAKRGVNIAPVSVPARDIYAGITRLDPTDELAPRRKLVLYNPKREQNGNITPSAVYSYRRADGSIMGYVLRHDLPDGGKETPMVQWARLPDGRECWCRLPFEKPRLLYGLERIGTSGQVLVVEGEKCADADWKLRGRPVVTWPGGTYGVKYVDWSPLKGRDIIIEPDPDKPGYLAAKNVAQHLVGIAEKVRFINVLGKELLNARDDF